MTSGVGCASRWAYEPVSWSMSFPVILVIFWLATAHIFWSGKIQLRGRDCTDRNTHLVQYWVLSISWLIVVIYFTSTRRRRLRSIAVRVGIQHDPSLRAAVLNWSLPDSAKWHEFHKRVWCPRKRWFDRISQMHVGAGAQPSIACPSLYRIAEIQACRNAGTISVRAA
jgi:hypothetical protein